MRLKSLQSIHPLTRQGQPPDVLNLMHVSSLEHAIPAGIIAHVRLHEYVAAGRRIMHYINITL